MIEALSAGPLADILHDEIEQVPAGAGRLDHVGAARLQLSLPCLRSLLACDPDLSGGAKGGQYGSD